jgi:alkylation response protein AidB-like acyl-CoA dehydrogenase
MTDPRSVISALEVLAAEFVQEIRDRQRRRSLDPEDFRRIADAGFLLTGVPAEQGGLWAGAARSARDYSHMARVLAHGDPSVALVASMHPAVTAFFLGVEEVSDAPDAWLEQRQWVIDQATDHWWGTIMSEPGSGGDIMKTRSVAAYQSEGHYSISGDKHFGSGSGHATYMITTGVCEGKEIPELFFLQYKDEPWDGSTGCQMTVEWDGMGMAATQSHAFRFENFPAIKTVSSEILERVAPVTSQISNMLFTGVVLGIADNAMSFAISKLQGKSDSMRSYERVEWIRCQNELWLAEQAYEGALRAIESEDDQAALVAVRAKVCCAELIESAMGRMAKVVGGASYSKAMPLAQWVEDVKALGFLRPPLPFAYDQLLS